MILMSPILSSYMIGYKRILTLKIQIKFQRKI